MAREMAAWLQTLLPGISPADWGEDACWLALMMTRDSEHNPPFYWLGRALDAVDDGGAIEVVRSRLVAAHDVLSCQGRRDVDERAQDVLSEACGYAWAAAHLGPATFEVPEGDLDTGAVRIAVPAHAAYVIPRRLHPVRSIQQVMEAIGAHTEAAGHLVPVGAHGIVYIDVWHEQQYAQHLGYRLELTEPLQHGLRHFAAEHRFGHVLTRPFQWGNPVEATY
ncbi:MAG: hypothetical protein EXR68_03085 [Dehalococcoidia bacterium]|nr:hypothetical protein [Dehalococcoidia bacterium]